MSIRLSAALYVIFILNSFIFFFGIFINCYIN
jgi:hypothetical protein